MHVSYSVSSCYIRIAYMQSFKTKEKFHISGCWKVRDQMWPASEGHLPTPFYVRMQKAKGGHRDNKSRPCLPFTKNLHLFLKTASSWLKHFSLGLSFQDYCMGNPVSSTWNLGSYSNNQIYCWCGTICEHFRSDLFFNQASCKQWLLYNEYFLWKS